MEGERVPVIRNVPAAIPNGGKPYVTDLIKLLDKPALLNWANKIGLKGVALKDYRQKALSAGKDWHARVESKLRDKIPFENTEHDQACNSFLSSRKILAF